MNDPLSKGQTAGGGEDASAEAQAVYDALVSEQSPEFFCDNCGHYPIVPMHGHFVCPNCHMPTKCCEGIPAEG